MRTALTLLGLVIGVRPLIVVGEQRAAAPVAVLGAEVAEKLFVDRSPARDPTVQLTGTPVTAGPQ